MFDEKLFFFCRRPKWEKKEKKVEKVMLLNSLAAKRSVLSNSDFSDCNPLNAKVSVFKCFMMFARLFAEIFPSANICSFSPSSALACLF